MKSTEIVVTSSGAGVREALDAAEKFAELTHLTGKEAKRLSLLTEETMSLLRAVTGEVEAGFWMENEDRTYSLHLSTVTKMTAEKRKQLLSASTTGENIAAKGFLGTVTSIFERFMESYADEGVPEYYTSGLILDHKGPAFDAGTSDLNSEVIQWSMNKYRDTLFHKKETDAGDAAAVWDELEKSILAKLADEVQVGIGGGRVELVITKTF